MKFNSPIASDASGSLGASVAARNRFGLYLRKRVAPVQPRTGPQLFFRANLAAAASHFRTLTQAEIAAWNSIAADFVTTDALGQRIRLTGLQLYIRCAQNLGTTVGGLPPNNPGTISDVPSVPPNANIEPIVGPPAHVLGLEFDGPVPAGLVLAVKASAPKSAGVNFVGNSGRRVITTFAAATASPASLDAAYTAYYGALPVSGMKAFFEVWYVHAATGYNGLHSTFQYLVP